MQTKAKTDGPALCTQHYHTLSQRESHLLRPLQQRPPPGRPAARHHVAQRGVVRPPPVLRGELLSHHGGGVPPGQLLQRNVDLRGMAWERGRRGRMKGEDGEQQGPDENARTQDCEVTVGRTLHTAALHIPVLYR